MEQPPFIGTNLPALCFSFVTIRGGFVIISTTIIWCTCTLNQNADKTVRVSPPPLSSSASPLNEKGPDNFFLEYDSIQYPYLEMKDPQRL